jgi:TolB-like protein/class 3 adenylate cyclase
MPLAREQRKLAAILFADAVGSSRLMGRDESGTVAGLLEHLNQRLAPAAARRGGRVVRLKGDGSLVEFASAVDALAAAIAFQQTMIEANRGQPDDQAIVFRIGLHLGDVIVEGDDIYGDAVNVAARLEAEAPAGGIVVSRAVREAVTGRLKVSLHALGELALKNIERPIRAFRAEWSAEDWPAHSVASGASASPKEPTPALTLPDKPSIAVLPFQNMGGGPDQDYFVDGLVEEIITALSRFKSIFVIARNASFAFKGQTIDLKQVGRDLGVRYVLQGSIRKSTENVRIAGQLIDCETGALLWAQRFDGSLKDVLDLQDQVASSVAGEVAPRIDEAETKKARQKPLGNLEAYDLFLRGMSHLHEHSEEGWITSSRLFTRAIELDPDYAPPYAMLMRFYWVSKTVGRVTDEEAVRNEVRRLGARVALIGKDDPLALSWAGFSLVSVCREQDQGEALVDRALSLNPNLATCWQVSGAVRHSAGQHEVAIQHLTRALRLSPVGPDVPFIASTMAAAYFQQGKYDEALRWTTRVLAQVPDHLLGLLTAAIANALAGNLDRARTIAAKLIEMNLKWRVSTLRELLPLRPADMEKVIRALRLVGFPE